MKKNLFIDLGTHFGEGLLQFIKMFAMNEESWEIHTFEPQPRTFETGLQRAELREAITIVPSLTRHAEAASTEYSTMPFFIESSAQNRNFPSGIDQLFQMTEGSTLVKDIANKWQHAFSGAHVEVKTIDIHEFIKNLTLEQKRENLVIKMDIEGAEFDVLNHMLNKFQEGQNFNSNNVELYCEFYF